MERPTNSTPAPPAAAANYNIILDRALVLLLLVWLLWIGLHFSLARIFNSKRDNHDSKNHLHFCRYLNIYTCIGQAIGERPMAGHEYNE